MLASVLVIATATTAAAEQSRLNAKLCKRAEAVMQSLTKQQVKQIAAAPAAARVVRDCYPFFANDVGTGELCLREQCRIVVNNGVATTKAMTREEAVSMCLDSAEDLIVINKTIELNYLNFAEICKNTPRPKTMIGR